MQLVFGLAGRIPEVVFLQGFSHPRRLRGAAGERTGDLVLSLGTCKTSVVGLPLVYRVLTRSDSLFLGLSIFGRSFYFTIIIRSRFLNQTLPRARVRLAWPRRITFAFVFILKPDLSGKLVPSPSSFRLKRE
jgi:hypothetical protein